MSLKVKVLTYNIRYARGTDKKISPPRTAGVIEKSCAQIIGLQEVDRFMIRSGLQNQAAKLAGMLKMDFFFGPTEKFLFLPLFGNAVLSRWKVAEAWNLTLPTRIGGQAENRCLIITEIETCGRKFYFLNTHLGLDQRERLRQVEAILEAAGKLQGPVLLAGDFNAEPASPEIRQIKRYFTDTAEEAGATAATFPSHQPRFRLDYIFASPHWEVLAARTVTSLASDHLPLLVELKLK